MHRPVTLILRPRRVARPAVVALVALAVGVTAMVVTACSTQSPTQTNVPYLPADGVPASIGPVLARDLLVVAQSKGSTGVLSGSLINTGSAPVSVTFLTVADSQGSGTGGSTVQLAAGQQQRITGVQFANLPAGPGAMTGIVLKTSAGLQNVQVPVLLPDGVYSTITATPMATSATTGGPPSTSAPPTSAPPTSAPPTSAPPTSAPPTAPTG